MRAAERHDAIVEIADEPFEVTGVDDAAVVAAQPRVEAVERVDGVYDQLGELVGDRVVCEHVVGCDTVCPAFRNFPHAIRRAATRRFAL